MKIDHKLNILLGKAVIMSVIMSGDRDKITGVWELWVSDVMAVGVRC